MRGGEGKAGEGRGGEGRGGNDHMHAQDKMHSQKRPESTLIFHLGPISEFSISLAKC
jgi:hypothetical protein